MVALRDSRWWDRQLEEGLPDCRLSGTARDNDTVVHAGMLWERVYCANCGHNGRLVTADFAAHIFYICEPCFAQLGPPPGAIEAGEPVTSQ